MIFNRLWKAIRRQTDADFADSEAFEKGCIGGIGYTVVDVNPRAGNPMFLDFTIDPVHPFEILIDPGAQRRDLRDAQFIIWNRWLREGEFAQEFPQHAAEVREIFELERVHSGIGYREIPETSQELHVQPTSPLDLPGAAEDTLYFDRRRRLIRVLHVEYRQSVRRFYALNPNTRKAERISERNFRIFRQAGLPIEFSAVWEEEIRWLELIGTKILFDDVQPVPMRGFSIKAYVCDRDHLTGEPRGLIRDLVDPQKEINKRHSQTLHMLNTQVMPGVFAESDAFVDDDDAETTMRTAGAITKLKTGALAAGKIQKREVPTMPSASAEMADRALQMFFRISGVNIDTMLGDRAANEPATTALLRYRRSIMAITKNLQNYQSYQKRQLEAVIDIIVNVLPDNQIEAMLGNPNRWRVRDGVVTDLTTQESARISGLADMEWDIELDLTAANTTISLLQLQIMLQMVQFQVPIDPTVLVDQLPIAQDKRNRLVAHIEALNRAQAEQTSQSQQQLSAKLASDMAIQKLETQLKAGELEERERHNTQLELVQDLKSERDFLARLLAVYQKADDDEKQVLLETLGDFLRFADMEEETRLQDPVLNPEIALDARMLAEADRGVRPGI